MDRAVYNMERDPDWIGLVNLALIGTSAGITGLSLFSGVSRNPVAEDAVEGDWTVYGPEGSFLARIEEVKKIGDLWKVILRKVGELKAGIPAVPPLPAAGEALPQDL